MCLGLYTDADINVMNLIWCYGGKLLEADNKSVALNSPGTVQAVKLIADMYFKHRIIPRGAIVWDNLGNNKAYQSRQVIFVQNPPSLYANLEMSDKALYEVTGMLPVPAGPAGAVQALSTEEWLLFKHNPYPGVAKGLVQYWMEPENLWVAMEAADGRWGPPYKQLYRADFWKRPAFRHWRGMLDRGRQFAFPRTVNAASGEVIDPNVIARMIHRVLVDSWQAEEAVEEAHKKVAEAYARWPNR
jgi:multiple sugar transport system substrate-binding protein